MTLTILKGVFGSGTRSRKGLYRTTHNKKWKIIPLEARSADRRISSRGRSVGHGRPAGDPAVPSLAAAQAMADRAAHIRPGSLHPTSPFGDVSLTRVVKDASLMPLWPVPPNKERQPPT